MITGLLADTSEILTYVVLVVFIVIIIVFFVISSRNNKKKQKEAEELIDAVKPGNKVKTIGGICGIVVEVDKEENTFVLETGTELSGKCYIKFDKQAIYQTDAVVEKNDGKKPATETDAGETASEDEPAEDTSADTSETAETADTSETGGSDAAETADDLEKKFKS